jgi:hypothetical protein
MITKTVLMSKETCRWAEQNDKARGIAMQHWKGLSSMSFSFLALSQKKF